jgi:glucan 1,3-beta-glucosidase
VRWEDFNKIKQAGFNVVRIPVGYWAYDTFNSPFVSGANVYIDAAIDWARSLDLKIVIDLHGAPGSQVSLCQRQRSMLRRILTQYQEWLR